MDFPSGTVIKKSSFQKKKKKEIVFQYKVLGFDP